MTTKGTVKLKTDPEFIIVEGDRFGRVTNGEEVVAWIEARGGTAWIENGTVYRQVRGGDDYPETYRDGYVIIHHPALGFVWSHIQYNTTFHEIWEPTNV